MTAGSILFFALFSVCVVFFLPNSFEPSPGIITVSRGQSFSSVADSLAEKRMLFSKITYKIAGRLLDVTQRMRVGKYSFESGVTNYGLLMSLKNGESTVNSSVAMVEGLRAKLYARILKRHISIDSSRFMELFKDTSLIGIYPHNASSLEGYLMPDTYNFSWQDDEKIIVEQMVSEFRKFFVDSLQQRMKLLKYDLNKVMTMASIIEGEAVHDDERPIIAGVYYNRLRIRMPLQADPTVLYAVSDYSRRLLTKDLQVKSPYNTYLHYGLPPGPINNPSKQSILAALYPAKHHYLYFVSDYNGRHRFARDYNEHLRNVRLYKKARAVAQNGNKS